ncbi:MAG: 3-hydroxyanthranilic acid dioxygenase [Lichina confinis]|nr:MAG: 3-hydroxyanthranilic acid dioxygenase [Lichina confinis]
MLSPPLNIARWSQANIPIFRSEDELSRLDENADLLKPPINNYCVYNEDFTVMIVGGPNERTDYHINETPEWFYQYKGDMLLKVVVHKEDGGQERREKKDEEEEEEEEEEREFRDVHIREGDMFLLPPNTPHNPVRFANTVGIVLEQRRPASTLDRLRWYCRVCRRVVHEKSFHCVDLGTQIKDAVNAFRDDVDARTCRRCGTVADVVAPKSGGQD